MFPQIPPSPASSSTTQLVLALTTLTTFFTFTPVASAQCQFYGQYAKLRHVPFSEGKHNLSYARPAPPCRTFFSRDLEEQLERMKLVIKDPDLYRVFENTWPSTLDTTVAWRGFADAGLAARNKAMENGGGRGGRGGGMPVLDGEGGGEGEENSTMAPGGPKSPAGPELAHHPTEDSQEEKEKEELSFIITGDIEAMWLRDSANQLQAYTSLLKPSPHPESLASLFRGAINLQARYILEAPFCNAFQPPLESNLTRTYFSNSDKITPPFDRMSASSCQWELDSLASFLQLSYDYLHSTDDYAFFGKWQWKKAVAQILDTVESMMVGSYDEEGQWLHTNYTYCAPYGGTPINDCNGSPHRGGIGLIRSFHRPSDDACTYQYLIPSNMMFAVALERTAPIMKKLEKGLPAGDSLLAPRMRKMAQGIRRGIKRYAHYSDPHYGTIYPYEIDGYGSANIMDDANIPSLLSAPFLGFSSSPSSNHPSSDPIYQNTRRKILSRDNPYYSWGPYISGIGSPHTLPGSAWPMSLVMQILTSEDDSEIRGCLKMLVGGTDGLGVMHESVRSHGGGGGGWTREWFSWANGLFGQMIVDLEKRKPHLLGESYQGD